MNPLFNTVFPHGTPDGFLRGCKTNHCPAAIACKDVYMRHRGDYRFRVRFDSGATLEQIAEMEAAEAAAALPPKLVPQARKRKRNKPSTDRPAEGRRLIPLDELKGMLAEGLTDREIADIKGLTRHQVANARHEAGLPVNRAAGGPRADGVMARLGEVEGLSAEEGARLLGCVPKYLAQCRLEARRRDAKQLREQEAA